MLAYCKTIDQPYLKKFVEMVDVHKCAGGWMSESI